MFFPEEPGELQSTRLQRVRHDWSDLAPSTVPAVKRLCTMWETWVQCLGREDPLEKEMAIHSITIAWKIPWTEKPDRLQSMGSQRVGHDWATSLSLSFTSNSYKGQFSRLNISLRVTKWWYLHPIIPSLFIGYDNFIERNLPSWTIWLPWGVVHIGKGD